ncbi:hypothetical protein [Pseudomonas koreensis]|uniref:hypothetical protein n=1 Tax=Pseudomonas koreensis TaxID=198620 RepID=UPI0020777DCA|nr:hypothetical protein [Pseudomonas koreensis]MCM8743982.1 hypothetical protein [Pseudomonas koreensis]
MKTKQERLAIIFERLRSKPPASNRDLANFLICKVVNEVEDEETGLPLDFNSNSGRMFFYSFSVGQWENLDSDPARLDLNGKHIVELYNNGSIVIFSKRYGQISEIFRKDGI